MSAFLLQVCPFHIYSGLMKWDVINKTKKGLKMVIFKLLFLSYMHTNLYFSFYHKNIDMLYIVHKYKKKLESTNMDLTHS